MREDAVVTLEQQRIVTDEQLLVAGEAEHLVARAIADQPLIGRDAHDRGIEVHPRLRVPAGVKRRLVAQPVVGDLDGCDPMV